MKRIEVYGPGCAKCTKLFANVETVVHELGLDCTLEKVTDIDRMVDAGVLMTPGLSIDGVLVSSGRVLGTDELKSILGGKHQ